MTRKKPDLYTKLGKPRKAVNREKSLEIDVTDLLAKLNDAYTQIDLARHSNEAIMETINLEQQDRLSRTINLWFGYALIRPAKK